MFALVTDWKNNLGYIIVETIHTLIPKLSNPQPQRSKISLPYGMVLAINFSSFQTFSKPFIRTITKSISSMSIKLMLLPIESDPNSSSPSLESSSPSPPTSGLSLIFYFDPYFLLRWNPSNPRPSWPSRSSRITSYQPWPDPYPDHPWSTLREFPRAQCSERININQLNYLSEQFSMFVSLFQLLLSPQ